MVYLLPIIIHFCLSNHFKIFRKCSWMVILLIFAKKRFFYFFEKSKIMIWGNWMRNPSYMDIFCLANYQADEVLQDVQCVLNICIHTFTCYNTKCFSYLSSTGCKIIITNRVNKQIKKLGMKGNKRVMKQAWPNQFRHLWSEDKQIWCHHGVLNTHYYTLLYIKSLRKFQKMLLEDYTTNFRKKYI